MTQYVIESGIPLPPARGGADRTIYPVRKLAPGQSFFLPDGKMSSISGTLWAAAKRAGIKISLRTVTENHKGWRLKGIRVWRIDGWVPDEEDRIEADLLAS